MKRNVSPTDLSAQQPFAFGGGITPARLLTRNDLVKIQGALTEFKKALAQWDGRRGQEQRKAAGKPASEQEDEQGAAQPDGQPDVQPSPGDYHCLIVAGYLGNGYGPEQDLSTDEAVADACARHFAAPPVSLPDGYPDEPRLGRIHVILQSRGGSLDSAYKIILYLRSYAKEVRVYVPCQAKSAATLIAIGADQIVMSPFSELGPLDTQITDPRNPATRVSALDCYRSVDYVQEFGVQTVPRALKVMLRETQALIPLAELLESATNFSAGSMRPMLEQVKGLDLGAWGRTLSIGENYAKEVRSRLRHPDTKEDAEKLAERLVYGYSHHLYPIDRAEAKSLGLAVDAMPGDVYRTARAIATACRGEARFVGFTEDVAEAIAKLAEPLEGARWLAPVAAKAPNLNGAPHAYGPVSTEFGGPVSTEFRGLVGTSDEPKTTPK